jgi:hypothetical protein
MHIALDSHNLWFVDRIIKFATTSLQGIAGRSNVERRHSVYFIKKTERLTAHTPRKRWRCGSACVAQEKTPFEILRFVIPWGWFVVAEKMSEVTRRKMWAEDISTPEIVVCGSGLCLHPAVFQAGQPR